MTALRQLAIGTRLMITALLLILIILPLAGSLLAYNFEQAATAAFDNRLKALLKLILADIDYDPLNDRLHIAPELGDDRFRRAFSGWYWQVTDGHARTLSSRSLWDQRLPLATDSDLQISTIDGPRNQRLRAASRSVHLPNLNTRLYLTVAVTTAELDAEVAKMRQLLWISLASLGLLLCVGLGVQIRWGLAPLRRINASLRAVAQGEQAHLAVDLPRELRELAITINTVLEKDRQLIERARHTAGNLAHALKTPLSVLTTLTNRLSSAERQPIQQELQRLDDAIRHHLARAAAAGPSPLSATSDLNAVLLPVVTGIAQLAERRSLLFRAPEIQKIEIHIDPQDLQEMAGNVLENALTWAKHEIRMDCFTDHSTITLTFADDGPGMTEDHYANALQRGLRLDETRSGSGLGLTIVNELVNLYGGTMTLGRAALGGLAVSIQLPK